MIQVTSPQSMCQLAARPNPEIMHRNYCFLELCIGSNNMDKFKREVDDLIGLDNGSWSSKHIHHHCGGVFCCQNIGETRAKLFNAIVVSRLDDHVVFFC